MTILYATFTDLRANFPRPCRFFSFNFAWQGYRRIILLIFNSSYSARPLLRQPGICTEFCPTNQVEAGLRLEIR